jgi:DNA-binding NarL/FixJ family response regulator
MACDLSPTVVLMDFAMPRMNGLLATREILRVRPHLPVLILSMHSEDVWIRQSIKAGARGYILKNGADLDLSSAIKRVISGEFVLDPQLSEQSEPTTAGRRDLRPRELEILQLIVDGKSNKEIASQLRLSENTVGVHRTNIMRELGVHKTAELVMYAIRKRLVNIL